MSMRYQAAILTASYFPLKTPSAPTVGTATAGNAQVSLTFTAPSDIGGGAITSYTVTVTDSSSGAVFTNTGASSPIIVTGLTNGSNYTAKVAATNAFGTGPNSASSNSFSPTNAGQQAYITPGSYSWIAPTGITSVSVVAVGGGGGSNPYYGTSGGGGALGYKNNITVVPGNSYSLVVGAFGVGGRNSQNTASNGGSSTFTAGFGTLTAGGGTAGQGNYNANTAPGGSPSGNDGGGSGGFGGTTGSQTGGGGGGGYSGNGGDGRLRTDGSAATAGSGGGGGGGFEYGGGGGVGILGQGSNGAAGTSGSRGGGGGSGGTNGGVWDGSNDSGTPKGGSYGAGGGYTGGTNRGGGDGGPGAVRIIWPGTSRSFPSTNTGDL